MTFVNESSCGMVAKLIGTKLFSHGECAGKKKKIYIYIYIYLYISTQFLTIPHQASEFHVCTGSSERKVISQILGGIILTRRNMPK